MEAPELPLTPWARKYRVAVLWYCLVRDLSIPKVDPDGDDHDEEDEELPSP